MFASRFHPSCWFLLFLGAGLTLTACPGDKPDTSDFFDDDDDDDDTTDPIVSLDAPTSGETVSGVVSWSATASDDNRVESVTFQVDGTTVSTANTEPWSGTWDSTAVSNGEHVVAAVAEDPDGNTGTSQVNVLVANEGGLDPSAVVITNPTGEDTVCGDVSVETTVSAEVVQVVFALNGVDMELDTNAPFSWAWDTTTVADGTYTVTATGSDADGLEAVDTVVLTVANDEDSCDNLPAIVFTNPLEGDYLAGSVDLEVTATDDLGVTSVSFYVDSGLLVTDSSVPYETTLSTTDFDDGAHTLKAVATDTAGQTGEAEITVFIDNEAPSLSIDDPDEADVISGELTFTVSADDNLGLDTVALYLDGELLEAFAAGPFEVVVDTTLLDHGPHTFEAYAIDLAGNESTDTVRVNADNPPLVVFTAPTDTTIYATATVAAEATDDDRVSGMSLYQDGEVADTTTTESSVSTSIETCDLTHGSTIEVEAIASDSGGNITSETLTLTVDQPIQVEIDEYTDALDYTATVGASVSDDQSITSVVWALDGTTVATSTRSSGSSEDCFDCGCTLYSTTWSTATASEGSHTLSVTATNSAGDTATDSTTVTIDFDHDDDGYDSEFYGGDDCDDDDATTNPDTAESCDGLDNDCDDDTDEDFDADGDGYLEEEACAGLPSASDCDDTDATVSPAAREDCDGVDDNCDGHIDNSSPWSTTTTTYGASSDTLSGSGMAGSVYKATTNSTITSVSAWLNPGTGGTSVTWAIYEATTSTGDYTLVDSNTSTPSGSATWYSSGTFAVDLTSGYYYLVAVGSSSTLTRYGDKTPSFSSGGGLTVTGYLSSTSTAPTTISTDPSTSQIYYQRVGVEMPGSRDADADADGTSTTCGDCKDTDASVGPDATEVCDDVDNDCDGTIDESADADGDGDEACSDCDDGDATAYTGGREVCDDVDNDCDGTVDDNPSDGTSYYTDFDDDGYGRAGGTTKLCEDATGYAAVSGDCDDGDATRSPGLSESCDGVDNDCDGTVDDGFDADGDGYGAGASCDDDIRDCDDTDPDINLDGTEVCNSKDDDCDGTVDFGATDGTAYYTDADGDGFGLSTSSVKLCGATAGYSTYSTDCDDGSATVYPGATETCNTVDDDCDGTKDDGFDSDGDGYASCSECDDTDAAINPGETEVCGNDIDDDCDGVDPHCHLSGTNDMGSTGYKLRGEAASDYAGWSLDGDGDQNGDGKADVLIGAYGNDEGGTTSGAVYIVPGGSISSSSLGGTPAIKLLGEDASDQIGYSVAYVGDQNGDGYDDLLAGGILIDDGGTDAGAALLVLGPTTSDTDLSLADARIYGEDASDYAGSAVAYAGDMNDDGEPDLLVGAYGADDYVSSGGTVYAVLGPTSSSMDLTTSDLKVYGSASSDALGKQLPTAGDTNGDGYSDLLMGCGDCSSSDYGAAYVILGPATGSGRTSTIADVTLTGISTSDYAGRGTAYGDVDGDGYDDVMMGAPGRTYSYSDAGAVYVFFGPVSTSASVSSADYVLYGAASTAYFGYSVDAGDLDEDGVEDLLIGAPYESDGGSSAGMAYVFYGPIDATGTTSAADASYVGEDSSDYMGFPVSIGGDMNADGGPDLLLGAYAEDHSSGTATGSVYVILQ